MAISLDDVQRGYDAWAAKPHNAKWVRKIDGTPIANDIVVNIFDTLRDNGLVEAARIGDAVLSWLVKYDLADAGNEYDAADVIEIMNDLSTSTAPQPVLSQPEEYVRETEARATAAEATVTALEKENAELSQMATRVVADAKLTDVFGNGAKHYIVTPYLLDALRTALRDAGGGE